MQTITKTRVITSREENSIDKYFKDISHIKLLTADEEIKLAEQIKLGGRVAEIARETLIKANLRFVISIAKQYQNKGVLLLDLINEGNIGLIHAIETFDETKGYRFISYAVYWIRQAILAALTEQSHLIHIPFNQYYLKNKISKLIEEAKNTNKQITDEEIASHFEIDEKDVRGSLGQISGFAVSLNNTLSVDNETSTLMDVVKNENIEAPDDNLMKDSMLQDLFHFLNKVLDEKEREIIVLNFGLGGESQMSFQEIADTLKINKESVRQIKEKALRKLRLHDGNVILKQYL